MKKLIIQIQLIEMNSNLQVVNLMTLSGRISVLISLLICFGQLLAAANVNKVVSCEALLVNAIKTPNQPPKGPLNPNLNQPPIRQESPAVKTKSTLEVLAPELTPHTRNSLEFVLKLTHLRHLFNAYEAVIRNEVSGNNIYEKLLKALNIRLKFDPNILEQIPSSGPLLITSNHPYGGIDGMSLMALIKQKRPDVKFMATSFLLKIPELREDIIAVNLESSEAGKTDREKAFKLALEHVSNGGALVMFPAGRVAQAPFYYPTKAVDSDWKPGAARILMQTGATSISVRFTGRNSVFFHVLGKLPGFRPIFLGGEVTNKRGREIEILQSTPKQMDWKNTFKDENELTQYLRNATDNLGK